MGAKEGVKPGVDVAVIIESGRVEDGPAAEHGRHGLHGCQLQLVTPVVLPGPECDRREK